MKGKRKNLIVFDWNGTILADTSACLRATNLVLGKLGLPHATIAQYRHHYTMPITNLYHALGIKPHILEKHGPALQPLWHDHYSAAKIRLRRGAKAMLHNLRPLSCETIILSNYLAPRIDEQARKLGVREHFHDIVAFDIGDTLARRTGKAHRMHDYLKTHPVKTGMIVGDTEEEVEIGRELGLTTVAITDGMCSTARLRAMKPDYLVRSLGEVPPIAHRLFGDKARAAS